MYNYIIIIAPPPQFLVSCVHLVFPEFTFQWLVEEIRSNLPLELDFCQEARNQERFSAMFTHLKSVHAREYSSSAVQ